MERLINLSCVNIIIYKYKLKLKFIFPLKLSLNSFSLIITLLNNCIYADFVKVAIKNKKIYIYKLRKIIKQQFKNNLFRK